MANFSLHSKATTTARGESVQDDLFVGLMDDDLSMGERVLLGVLIKHADWGDRQADQARVGARPSMATLADCIGRSVRWTRRLVARLEQKRRIARQMRFQSVPQRGETPRRGLQVASWYAIWPRVAGDAHPADASPAAEPDAQPPRPSRPSLSEVVSKRRDQRAATKAEQARIRELMAQAPVPQAVRTGWLPALQLASVGPSCWTLQAPDPQFRTYMLEFRHFETLRQWLIDKHGFPDIDLI